MMCQFENRLLEQMSRAEEHMSHVDSLHFSVTYRFFLSFFFFFFLYFIETG